MNRCCKLCILSVALAVGLAAAPAAQACAVCFGAPGDQNTVAAGNAILFMLGVLAVVLGTLAAVVGVLIWRAGRRAAAEDERGDGGGV